MQHKVGVNENSIMYFKNLMEKQKDSSNFKTENTDQCEKSKASLAIGHLK